MLKLCMASLLLAGSLVSQTAYADAEVTRVRPSMQEMQDWKRAQLARYDAMIYQDADGQTLSETAFFRKVVDQHVGFSFNEDPASPRRVVYRVLNGATSCEQRFLTSLVADGAARDALKMFDFDDAAALPAQQVGQELTALMQRAGKVSDLQPLIQFPSGASTRVLVGQVPSQQSYIAQAYSALSENYGAILFQVTRRIDRECAVTSVALHIPKHS